MKIWPNGLIPFHKAKFSADISNKTDNAKKLAGIDRPVSDKIEISEKGMRQREIAAAKAGLVESIERAASEKRIQELRERIQSGDYHIPSKDIADAILKNR